MQLMVEKADGSAEVYLHTKVLGSIAGALSDSGQYQEDIAEQLAETVTSFLRRRHGSGRVTSDEIHSMIEVVLAETDHSMAALALHEHRIHRQIKRNRLEVIRCEALPGGAGAFYRPLVTTTISVQPWDKSVMVRELERGSRLPHDMARAIAGTVEEKVLRLECSSVTSSLVRELVANELIMLSRATSIWAEPIVEERAVAGVC